MGILDRLFIQVQMQDDTASGLTSVKNNVEQGISGVSNSALNSAAGLAGVISGITSMVAEQAIDLAQEAASDVVSAFEDCISTGLNMEALMWRIGAAYGSSADYMVQKSADISNALGDLVTQTQALTAMQQGGMLFSALGLTDDQVANLTQAAAAMGIIRGTSTQDAMQAIMQAMQSGRTTQLKGYGVEMGTLSPKDTPEQKAQEVYAAIAPKTQDLTNTAATFSDTGSGQIQIFQNHIEELEETIGKLAEGLAPALKPFNDAFEQYLPVVEKQIEMVKVLVDAFGKYFSMIGGNMNVMGMFKDYLTLAYDCGMKLFTAIYDLIQAFEIFGQSTGYFTLMGNVVQWLYGIYHGFITAVYNGLLTAAQIILVFAGMWEKTHGDMGLIAQEFATLIISTLLKWISDFINILGGWAKQIVDMGIGAAQGFANSIIDVINAGLKLIQGGLKDWIVQMAPQLGNWLLNAGESAGSALVNGMGNAISGGISSVASMINNWLGGLPSWISSQIGNLTGVGGAAWGGFSAAASSIAAGTPFQIQHVDYSGITSQANDMIDSLVDSANSMISDFASKYGFNVTLDDLAKKYGVDLDAFKNLLSQTLGSDSSLLDPSTGLPSLDTSLKQLNHTINGKNMSQNINLYLNVSVANADDPEEIKALGDTIEQRIVDTLTKKLGVVS